MSLKHKILGDPFKDNAMYINVDTGHRNYHLLFDLGYACLEAMEVAVIMDIDHVFLSHLHVDHIAGFDYFFRFNYDRNSKPLHFWVPEGAANTLHNKFLGFTWNLLGESTSGIFYIHEVKCNSVLTYEIKAAEKFEKMQLLEEKAFDRILLENEDFEVQTIILNHGIPCNGYFVKEKSRLNISKDKMNELGIKPGPWLGQLKKKSISETEKISVNNKQYSLKYLKEILLKKTLGDSIAYLTDFFVDDVDNDDEIQRISNFLKGCNTLICESQYSDEDHELAYRNMHITAGRAGKIAQAAKIQNLILFHISSRYNIETIHSLLMDAKKEFIHTTFPENWTLQN